MDCLSRLPACCLRYEKGEEDRRGYRAGERPKRLRVLLTGQLSQKMVVRIHDRPAARRYHWAPGQRLLHRSAGFEVEGRAAEQWSAARRHRRCRSPHTRSDVGDSAERILPGRRGTGQSGTAVKLRQADQVHYCSATYSYCVVYCYGHCMTYPRLQLSFLN